uniref:Uncharacterized protein n=1 Tax=Panagrolaimus superbus TaxID=310955 RepID=A0A914XXT8_9BILA
MDVFHWISATLLSKYNWRILKNNRATRSNKLSQRYQVNENIRVLEIILPISRVGCIFTLVSTWIVMVVLLTNIDNKYAAPLYYMVINAFVTVAFFMSMKAQSITPRILCRIIFCQNSYRGNERSISPSHVKNIMGEELIIYHHGDDHFKCLQDQWHVSFTNLHTMDLKGSPI